MRGGEEAGEVVEDVDAAIADHRVDEIVVRQVFGEGVAPQRGEGVELEGRADLHHEGVDLGDQGGGPGGEALLQLGAGVAHVQERGLGGGQGQRVAHEGAGEVGDADGGDRGVAVLPVAAVEGVHELALAGDDADGEAAADDLAVGGEVGLDVEEALRAARVGAEAGDDLVEDEQGAALFGEGAQLAEELHGLEVGAAALHRLGDDRRQLVAARLQDLEGLGGAVIEDEHVHRGRRHDAGGRRDALELAGAADDDLVEDAVIGAGEHDDEAAPGHRAGDAHAAHHRLGAGVAEAGAVGAGEIAEQLGALAGQHVLRADLVAEVDLLVDGLAQEVGLPAKQVHAEAVEHVDVLVAVEVPQAAAARALDDELIGQLLGERAKAVDHARVGHAGAVVLGVLLGFAGALGVAGDQRVEAGALLRRHLVGLGVDAGDGAEGLLDVVADRAGGRLVLVLGGGGLGGGDGGGGGGGGPGGAGAGSGRSGLRSGGRRSSSSGGIQLRLRLRRRAGEHGELLLHQRQLLLDHLADERRLGAAGGGRVGHRRVGHRLHRLHRLHRGGGGDGSLLDGIRRQPRVEHAGEGGDAGELFHHLAEAHLDRVSALHGDRQLGEGERIEAQLQPRRLGIVLRDVGAGDLFDELADRSEQAVATSGSVLSSRHDDVRGSGERRSGKRAGRDAGRSEERRSRGEGRGGRSRRSSSNSSAGGRRVHPVAHPLERVRRQRQAAAALALAIAGPVNGGAHRPQLAEGGGHRFALALGRIGEARQRRRQRALAGRRLPGQRGERGARADLDQHAAAIFQQRGDRRPEAHRAAQVLGPVARALRGGGGEPAGADGGEDRDLRRRQRDLGEALGHRLDHRVHHRRVEGVRGDQAARRDLGGGQLGLEGGDAIGGARGHAQAGRVLGGDDDAGGQPRGQLLGGQPHRQHAARRLRLHQAAALEHQAEHVGQRHHLGDGGGGELADAVADQRGRPHAPAHPQLGQRILQDEDRRLGDARRGERRRILGEEAQPRIFAGDRFEDGAAVVVGGAERRLAVVEAGAHAGVLRALAGAEQAHFRKLGAQLAGAGAGGVGGGEQAGGLGGAAGDDIAAMAEAAAADLQRVRDVGQLGLGGQRLQIAAEASGGLGERRGGARREHQQLGGAVAAAAALGGRGLLEHGVAVGATEAKRADAGAARLAARLGRPRRQRALHAERRALEVDLGAGRGEVDGRRQRLVVEGERRLDEAGGAGGDHHVADVALERADGAEAAILGVAREGAGEALDLDRIAQRRGGAVRLDIGEAARVDAGAVVGGGDDGGLALGRGRGEAGALGAVVVDGGAQQHGVDRIAVGQRVGEAAQHHHGDAVGEHGAAGLRVEGAGVAIRRGHRALLKQMAAGGRAGDGDAAGQRQIAAAAAQRVHRHRGGHQRGRAGGVHADGGAGEAELVGDAGGDVILLVAEHHLQLAHAAGDVGAQHEVALEVRRVVHAAEHADGAGGVLGDVAGVLERGPRHLEEVAVLRIHQLRFERRDAEEAGVEQLDVVEDAAGGDVGRIGDDGGGDAGIELGGGEVADRLGAVAEVLPERLDIGGAGEAAGHADDGDGLVGVAGAAQAARPRGARGRGGGVGSVAGHGAGQRRGGGRGEERRRPDLGQAGLAQAGEQAHRQERVAAQLEEAVERADAIEAEQIGEDVAHRGLALAGGGAIRLGQLGAGVARRRQPGAIELAVGGDGQGGELDVDARHHEVGQLLAEGGAQRRRRDRSAARPAGRRHHVGDQALAGGAVVADHHGAGGDGRLFAEARLDLAQLDAEAAQLDLVVGAAAEIEGAVGPPAHPIAGAIEAAGAGHRRRERVGDEALGVQLGAAEIAAGDAEAADVQLTDDADGHRLAGGVQDVELGVGDGIADGDGAELGGQLARDRVRRGEGRALGGAVAVEQLGLGQGGEGAAHVARRQRLAAGVELAQAAEVARIVVDDGVEQGRGEPRRGDAVAGDDAGEARAGGDGIAVDDDGAAVQQRAPQLEGGGVEAQRRGVQEAGLLVEGDVARRADQADDRAVLDLHALGHAGGARGVHDVGAAIGKGALGAGAGLVMDGGLVVDEHGAQRQRGEAGQARAAGHQHGGAGVADGEGQALGGIVGIQRQVGAARFQDGQRGDHRLGAALEHQGHRRVGGDAGGDQPLGQHVGGAIQLAIGEAALVPQERGQLGVGGGALAEQAVHRGLGAVAHLGAIPGGEHEGPLGGRQRRELRQLELCPRRRPFGELPHHLAEQLGQPRRVAAIEARRIEVGGGAALGRVPAQRRPLSLINRARLRAPRAGRCAARAARWARCALAARCAHLAQPRRAVALARHRQLHRRAIHLHPRRARPGDPRQHQRPAAQPQRPRRHLEPRRQLAQGRQLGRRQLYPDAVPIAARVASRVASAAVVAISDTRARPLSSSRRCRAHCQRIEEIRDDVLHSHGMVSSIRASNACTMSIGTVAALSAASEFHAALPCIAIHFTLAPGPSLAFQSSNSGYE